MLPERCPWFIRRQEVRNAHQNACWHADTLVLTALATSPVRLTPFDPEASMSKPAIISANECHELVTGQARRARSLLLGAHEARHARRGEGLRLSAAAAVEHFVQEVRDVGACSIQHPREYATTAAHCLDQGFSKRLQLPA